MTDVPRTEVSLILNTLRSVFAFATATFTLNVYVATLSSSAVTVIVTTLLSPATKPVFPETEAPAAPEFGEAATATCVVPIGAW